MLERDQARLFVVGDSFQHRKVFDLPDLLEPGDLIILNNTKVIPARLFTHRKSGGRVEIFLLERSGGFLRALINSSKALRDGEILDAPGDIEIVVEDSAYHGEGKVRFPEGVDVNSYLLKHGLPPLPPYIKREVRQRDFLQYQTIYAEIPGAVAAPTAGLHFTPRLLENIYAREIRIEYLTLHVGLGTFQPVRVENIEDHIMHAEHYEISPYVWESVEKAERVVAVGTTTLRALETVAITHRLSGKTDLFITPGFDFQVVDKLMTNFHQPRTTLFMLVSAFAGREKIKAAYKEAIANNYRLFSYGDAMLLMPA